jgi:hypothetical protein
MPKKKRPQPRPETMRKLRRIARREMPLLPGQRKPVSPEERAEARAMLEADIADVVASTKAGE